MLEAKNRLSSLIAPVERGEEVREVRINPPGAWKGFVAHSPIGIPQRHRRMSRGCFSETVIRHDTHQRR